MRVLIHLLIVLFLCIACYGVNSKTSQIGNLNTTCLQENTWKELTKRYSFENCKDSIIFEHIDKMKNHFAHPDYILYFPEGPEEIIACDFYSVRAVYNQELADQVLDGLSQDLSDQEQIRIRNRIQNILMEFQCEKGKDESIEWMKRPAIFSEEK